MAVTQSLTLTEKSYSIANNTSQVRLLWTSTQTGQSHNDYTRTASYTINGTTYTVSYTLPANTTKTIVDKTFTIQHNADGTKTVTASTKMDTGISAGVVQKSASLTLTAIPRASTISATAAYIGSSTTITIKKSDANYTSTLYYSLDGGTTKVQLGAAKTSSSQVTWTIPDEFYAKIPNAKSGKIYFYCNTYNGTTQMGSQTSCSITASAVESVCKPSIYATIQDTYIPVTDATGNANVIIPKASIARFSISASANKNATLVNYSIKCGTDKVSNTLNGQFSPAQSNKFTLTATDTRGYTTTVDIEKPTVAWIPITGTITGEAPNPSTNKATITVNGKWFNGNFGAVVNALTVVLYAIPEGGTAIRLPAPTITKSGDNWSATIEATGLDYRKAWTYAAQVSDKLSAVTWYSAKVSSIPTFDWGADSFNFNVPLFLQGEELADFVVEEGTSGIWTYRKWHSGLAECWGRYAINGVQCNSGVGNWYKTGNIELPEYPFAFETDPEINLFFETHTGTGGLVWSAELEDPTNPVTKTQPGMVYIIRMASSNSISGWVNASIKGKWDAAGGD